MSDYQLRVEELAQKERLARLEIESKERIEREKIASQERAAARQAEAAAENSEGGSDA